MSQKKGVFFFFYLSPFFKKWKTSRPPFATVVAYMPHIPSRYGQTLYSTAIYSNNKFFHFALQKKHFRNSQNVIVLRFVCLSLSFIFDRQFMDLKKEENFHFGLNRHSLNLNTKQQQQQEAHQKKKKKKSTTKEE